MIRIKAGQNIVRKIDFNIEKVENKINHLNMTKNNYLVELLITMNLINILLKIK